MPLAQAASRDNRNYTLHMAIIAGYIAVHRDSVSLVIR